MAADPHDFHLTGGGPIATLAHRAPFGRLLEDPRPRAVALAILLWVPALALAVWQGVALPGSVRIPFLLDPEVHLRYLLSIPLFVLAERTIDQACGGAIAQFVTSGLVPESELAALRALLDQAGRREASKLAAVVIALLAVVPLFYGGQPDFGAVDAASTWMYAPHGGGPSLAGLWVTYVAQGVGRYVIFGWIWRLMIWTMLLGRITTLKLTEMPAHPDQAAGFGFLGVTQSRFAILAVASGVGVMGGALRLIVFEGAKLRPMYVPIAMHVLSLTLLLLLPLLAVVPRLFRMRRQGLFAYGAMAAHYAQGFDRKWVAPGDAPRDALLGSEDIQSMADMGRSYDLVRQMKAIPIDRAGIITLAGAAAAPFLPLVVLDPETFALVSAALRRML
ncbi:MAG TPA: hypothetical protein VMT93_00720 [Gemmatimonadaceae bacterium]|nr:hypothetical protein [Gemmatimonadaceae bacterium]